MKVENINIKSILLISGVVILGILWVLFWRGLIPGNQMDVFCLLSAPTVLIVIVLINLGRGAGGRHQKSEDSPDRFGKSI